MPKTVLVDNVAALKHARISLWICYLGSICRAVRNKKHSKKRNERKEMKEIKNPGYTNIQATNKATITRNKEENIPKFKA